MLLRSRSFRVPLPINHHLGEVDQHQHIHDEDCHLGHREPPQDLHDLDGQKRRGNDQGEVFTPRFLEIQADPFEDADGSVAKRAETNPPEKRIIEQRSAFEHKIHESGFGVEPQVMRHLHQDIIDVFVQKAKGSHSDGDKEQRLQQLVNRDEYEALIVAAPRLRYLQ